MVNSCKAISPKFPNTNTLLRAITKKRVTLVI